MACHARISRKPANRNRRRAAALSLAAIFLFLLLFPSRELASALIDYSWWKELGHLDTWVKLFLYGTVPVALRVICFWAAFFAAFRLGTRSEAQPLFGCATEMDRLAGALC